MFSRKKLFFSLFPAITLVFLCCFLAAAKGAQGLPLPAGGGENSPQELDSQLISITVNGAPYTESGPAVVLETDEVFKFTALMKNTGTDAWGQFLDQGERGAALLSRAPDYNETFGVFFISPGQTQRTQPQETFTYNASLRAPAEPGAYTMTWQLADWIIPYQSKADMSYETRPFYGDAVTVHIIVEPRAEQPPAPQPRVPGVLDIYDLEYEGSFTLPVVPGLPQGDEKAFFLSGLTLRTVNGEKRLIMATGTYTQTLYEAAIPEFGKFVGNDDSAVPIAELRTVFGNLPKAGGATTNGTMWYDESEDLLYWTNYHTYYTPGTISFPTLRSARLEGGVLVEDRQWFQPGAIGGAPLKSFWGGVTGLPAGFAQKYADGRRLALGFGGAYSIIATASWGPSCAAVTAAASTDELNLLPLFYSTSGARTWRDGNYLPLNDYDLLPLRPWQGTWTSNDNIISGVFIDLPDKQGYVTFARQAIGRIGYDYGGSNWNGKYQNVWYFYDFDTLGRAALDQLPHAGLTPSSTTVVTLPYEPTAYNQIVAGSCFDPETRRLYLYTMYVLKGRSPYSMYYDPAVHVYKIKEDIPLSGAVLYQNSGRAAAVELYSGAGNLFCSETTTAEGAYTLSAPAGVGYTLVVSKPGYLSYTVKNLTLTAGEAIETIDIRQLAGDIDGNGVVNATDLTYLLSEFNRNPADSNYPYADIDGNGIVNATDLTYLLAGFNKHDVVVINN